ncbi:MAG: thioredoxin family protein [Cyanobacteria bacterium SZAS LIN-2]|nr:thioredoxin family protein [Cyanobacteria bacterium SZAS LIN-2]
MSEEKKKQKPSAATYALRLTTFLVVCLLLGTLVLILCFAPATNPSFLIETLYRGHNRKDLKDFSNFSRMLCGPDAPSVRIFDALARPMAKDEFKNLGLEDPEICKYKTSDGVEAESWYFKGPGPDTVLICYNGFGKRLPVMTGYIKMLRDAGLSVFLFDYRGLNETDARPTVQTAVLDAQAAYDYLVKQKGVSPDHLVLLGRDLGSYVCLKLAATNKCKALILENPWTTVKEFAEAVPGAMAMRLVPQFMYTDDCLNNLHLVAKDHPPIMVLTADPEITGSGNFYAAISAPKTFMYVEEYMPQMLCPDLGISGQKYTDRIKNLLTGENLSGANVASINWSSDYQSALQKAKQSNKPLLVDFTASWCVFCRKMDQTTFIEPDVVARINSDFIPVKLDEQNKDAQILSSKFEFQALPTVLVLDGDGNLKKKITGFVGPDRFLKLLAQK